MKKLVIPPCSPAGSIYSIRLGFAVEKSTSVARFAKECLEKFLRGDWGLTMLHTERVSNQKALQTGQGEVIGLYPNSDYNYDLLLVQLLPDVIVTICYPDEWFGSGYVSRGVLYKAKTRSRN